MRRRIPIRAGTVWTSIDEPVARLVAGATAAVRQRAERAEPFGALALGAIARLGLAAAGGAIRRDVGVCVGTALGCFATNAAYQRRLAGPDGAASPRLFAGTVSNAAAGEIGIAFGLGGPAITVTAGAASGLTALAAARSELAAGDVAGIVVAALDVVDEAGRRWLTETARWPADTPAEEAAAMALGAAPAELPVVGWLGGVALGLTDGVDAAGVGRVARRVLADAGLRLSDVRVRVSRSRDEALVAAALGVSTTVIASPDGPPLLAAGGPSALLAGLRADPEPSLVVDVCPSGHVAAAVAWRAAA